MLGVRVKLQQMQKTTVNAAPVPHPVIIEFWKIMLRRKHRVMINPLTKTVCLLM